MPNSKLILEDCIFTDHFITPDRKLFRGKIHWMEGSLDFKKGCQTFSANAIALLEANQNPEARFSMVGSLTKKPGKKGTKWENNFFEEIVIQELVLVAGANKFSARELVDGALKKQTIAEQVANCEDDEEVPF